MTDCLLSTPFLRLESTSSYGFRNSLKYPRYIVYASSNNKKNKHVPKRKKESQGRGRNGNVGKSRKDTTHAKKDNLVVYTVYTSGLIPEELEEVLQAEEPVVTPLWSTFLNSTSGVWKGVAASFSPLTGDFEPLGMNSQKKYLFHADTEVAAISSKEATMVRKTTLRPRSLEAESKDSDIGLYVVPDEDGVRKEISESNSDVTLDESPLQNEGSSLSILPDDDISGSDADESEEDFEFQEEDDEVSDISSSKAEETSDDSLLTVIDEEEMKCEPGLVYFEDGSYSFGPLDLLPTQKKSSTSGNGATNDVYIPPVVFLLEQCVVRGGHTRVRLQQTICVDPEGESLQCLRIRAFLEEWMAPYGSTLSQKSNPEVKSLLSSERTKPSDLIGSWKKFEICATLVSPEPLSDLLDSLTQTQGPSQVYFCSEVKVERKAPTAAAFQVEQSGTTIEDISVTWLPAGITSTLHVAEDGFLTLGVGWLAEDGTRLTMERTYDSTGKLFEVKAGTEIKGNWVGGQM